MYSGYYGYGGLFREEWLERSQTGEAIRGSRRQAGTLHQTFNSVTP